VNVINAISILWNANVALNVKSVWVVNHGVLNTGFAPNAILLIVLKHIQFLKTISFVDFLIAETVFVLGV
jgi:hypothetical protein